MFRVGMKVVCVDAQPAHGGRRWEYPVCEGRVYTIRALMIATDGGEVCYLNEVTRPVEDCRWDEFYGREVPLRLRRFRPAVDISDLESIVTEVFKGKPRKITGDNPLDHNAPVVPGRGYVDHLNHFSSARALGRSAAVPRAAGADASPTSAPILCPDAIPPSRVDRELAAEALQ